MLTRPLVTVITPAYDRADYLAEVIESVLAQDYPSLEYIVLDDGSTDGTRAVMDRYADRIRIETHPNMGETRTVNRGFELANGEIIGVVNSDDPLLPGAITGIVKAFEDDPDILVAYPDWDTIDSEGARVDTIQTREYSYVNMIRWHLCMPGPGSFFRRSVVDRLGGRNPDYRYIADYEFWLRAGLLGPFKRVPHVLATFRRHAGGASASGRGRVMADEHIRLIRQIYALPDLPSEVRRVRREAFSSAYYVAGVTAGDSSIRKKAYYLRAILYSPRRYWKGYTRRRLLIQRELRSGWPGHVKNALRWLVRRNPKPPAA